VWWLVEGVEIEELNHNVINHSKEMTSMCKFHLVTVFNGEILEINELVIKDINDPNLIRKRDQ
jgi:hypothetical protein